MGRPIPERQVAQEAPPVDPQGSGAPAPALPQAPTVTASETLHRIAALHDRILARIGPGPVTEDELIRDLGARPREVAPALVDLELEGRIRRNPTGLLTRAT